MLKQLFQKTLRPVFTPLLLLIKQDLDLLTQSICRALGFFAGETQFCTLGRQFLALQPDGYDDPKKGQHSRNTRESITHFIRR